MQNAAPASPIQGDALCPRTNYFQRSSLALALKTIDLLQGVA
jgi:hypothetical protein